MRATAASDAQQAVADRNRVLAERDAVLQRQTKGQSERQQLGHLKHGVVPTDGRRCM